VEIHAQELTRFRVFAGEKKKKIVDNFKIYISRASKQVQHLVEINISSAFMKEEEEEEEEYSFFFGVEVLGGGGGRCARGSRSCFLFILFF
jgi:hypothetical protein